ncbi:tRNA (guanine-N(7)-)-methyltransferase [Segniliparus rotundus DSM 44985]|uniref:tRNA (guanine-N(7)-)-methyltransferase n=1 Tax=Segniliparus rotundus (strain ATCC BAA-972 / CDC 1076 / CIP 108378 / DSM 44985 / JCM 13578) TaxID=640132 RepID=D6ZDK7_SEGRD|nr:tRNA (guanosine(46)-N7)-methyltransferase TrmB [Segniliparus rotundus]ADG99264.1 tRNA (guanine-N(7)-)-methyltransferase [Segniliparus rotundus DSM 44985]
MTARTPRRPVAVTVGRRGTLSPVLQDAWDRLWPRWGMRIVEGGPDSAEEPRAGAELPDLVEWFGRAAPLVLDIGFGNGAATAALAEQLPDHNVLAVERYKPGLAQLLQLLDGRGLDNVRLLRADATAVLDRLPPGSLAMARILFPDPWPKTRHHKRRLVNLWTVAQIAERLCVGGVLHVATDDANYAEAIAGSLADEPRLVALPAERSVPSRPTTAFEARAQRAGRVVTEFAVSRRTTGSAQEPGND